MRFHLPDEGVCDRSVFCNAEHKQTDSRGVKNYMTATKENLKDLIKTEVSGSDPCVKSVKFTVPAEAV